MVNEHRIFVSSVGAHLYTLPVAYNTLHDIWVSSRRCRLWFVPCGQSHGKSHNPHTPITQNTAWLPYRALTTPLGWQPYAETCRGRIWNVLIKNPLLHWAVIGLSTNDYMNYIKYLKGKNVQQSLCKPLGRTGVVEVHFHSFITAAPGNRCVINFTPRSLYPQYIFKRRLGVPQGRSWLYWEEVNLLLIMGIEPRFLICTTCSLATTPTELSQLHTLYLVICEDT
jgi:hypothetical protein